MMMGDRVMWPWRKKALFSGIEDAATPDELIAAVLSYLRSHRKWYAEWSSRYSYLYNGAALLIVILGALTAILSAYGRDSVPKPVIVILPALSSLAATLLVQFRLKDMCRIRELGRLATEELICDALALPHVDIDATRLAVVELRRKAHALERDQLSLVMTEATGRG